MRTNVIKFDSETVKGEIEIEILKGRDRLAILKQIKLTPDENGTLSFNDSTIDALINGTDVAQKYVKRIDLMINEESVTTFEDLEYSSAYNTVIMRLIGVLLNGPERLGNLLKS